jgi:hypothetical protein
VVCDSLDQHSLAGDFLGLLSAVMYGLFTGTCSETFHIRLSVIVQLEMNFDCRLL